MEISPTLTHKNNHNSLIFKDKDRGLSFICIPSFICLSFNLQQLRRAIQRRKSKMGTGGGGRDENLKDHNSKCRQFDNQVYPCTTIYNCVYRVQISTRTCEPGSQERLEAKVGRFAQKFTRSCRKLTFFYLRFISSGLHLLLPSLLI